MRVRLTCFLWLTSLATADELLQWMDGIAQRQLAERRKAIQQIRSVEQAEARKREVRAKILGVIGGLPAERTPLRAQVAGSVDRGGYVIEKVQFESLPNYRVTANLYRPKPPGRYPAVLIPMGHWNQGKAAAQLIAANLALKGFIAMAYDPVGQGERQQAYDPRFGRSLVGGGVEQHLLAGAQALLVGQSLARYRIWDGMRALDYLTSRADVDSQRIGVTGCSGGGTLTTYIAALDERVKVAAPACYMNSFEKLFSGPTGDSEQSPPRFLAEGLDQADYVELFAPKPWLILSTEKDFFTPEGARIVYEEAARWYAIYGAAEKLRWVVGPGPHGTPLPVREAIYGWMIRWLKDGQGSAAEETIEPVPQHQLWVTPKGQVGGRELYEIIREARGHNDLRQIVLRLVIENREGPGAHLEVHAPAGSGRRRAVILLEWDRPVKGEAERLTQQGAVAAVLRVRGKRRGPAPLPLPGDWITNTRAMLIGRNLAGMRASDIAQAAEKLASDERIDPAKIEVYASGVSGIWALLAMVAQPRIQKVWLDGTPYSLRAALDSPVHRDLHDAVVPGMLLAGDLGDLVRLVAPRQVVWTDPNDWMGNVIPLPGPWRYRSGDDNAPGFPLVGP